ncbi:PREDICTED: uncharacterized protein LOC108755573 [Trachymyrmex septentrionalis]|uniref:uncharacterized protein LOC108755573 n=1 Tax=Trachymyrmex septentrionalis TaxID=34720 RepID=UPI00084F00B3|nr:PREDICTED: uncharacterized protein LOC108755573 [Trachymyrmex septentrionalis]
MDLEDKGKMDIETLENDNLNNTVKALVNIIREIVEENKLLRKEFETLASNRKRDQEEDTEAELENEEIERHIKRIKTKKAAGADDIPGEAWLYSVGEARDGLKEILKEVCRGEGYLEEWRKGFIFPLRKKGCKDDVRNYITITLLNTAYKIYTNILTERSLKNDVESKQILPEVQAGFREERSMMVNIYVLQHIVEKELKEDGDMRVFCGLKGGV